MKKTPTIFERDWNGDRSRVVDEPNPGAAWVFAGEGWPTQKLDGTSCMVRDLKLFKRREMRAEEYHGNPPVGFELVDSDLETGKVVGWVPVGDGPEDRWHNDALKNHEGIVFHHPDGRMAKIKGRDFGLKRIPQAA